MRGAVRDAGSALQLWSEAVEVHGDRIAYRYRDQQGAWRDLTFRGADAAAREIGAGLAALGVPAGAAVAVLAGTRVEWVLADVGIVCAGALTVPIYPSSTAEQCAFILEDSGAALVIVEDPMQLEKLLSLGAGLPPLPIVYIANEARSGEPGAGAATCEVLATSAGGRSISAWEGLRASGRAWLASHAGEMEVRRRSLDADRPFTIVYTSGTTGRPKGVVLTHGNLIAECGSARRALAIGEQDVQYLFLPLAHVLGRMLVWSAASAGSTTAIAASSAGIKDDLVEVRPTFMIGVPLIYERIQAAIRSANARAPGAKARLLAWALATGGEHAAAARAGRRPSLAMRARFRLAEKLVLSKLRARLGLDRCRFLGSGGAPLAPAVAELFHAMGLLILEGYGLTETMGGAFMNRIDSFRFGSVGRALDVVEARLAPDGEVLLRGPTVFERYHNQPAATEATLDAEGWLHTGDVGTMKDGFLYITDRKKDIIVTTNGEKVAPLPIECALKAQSPDVSHAMIYGDRRPHCVTLLTLNDEAVARFGGGDRREAARSPTARAALQAAIETLNARLPGHERIRAFAILSAELTEQGGELTPSLKIRRKVVAERYAAEIAGLYDR